MSERGDAFVASTTRDLLNHVPECVFCNEPLTEDVVRRDVVDLARSICEHLGITWEMVDSTEHMPVSGQVALAEASEMVDQKDAMRDALATILEAAGIER